MERQLRVLERHTELAHTTFLLLYASPYYINHLQVDAQLELIDVAVLLGKDSFTNIPYFERFEITFI